MQLRRPFERSEDSVVPPLSSGLHFRDDFLHKLLSSFDVNGGGGATFSAAPNASMGASHPGCVTGTVTALGDGNRIRPSNSADGAMFFGGGEVTLEWVVHVVTLSDGVNNLVLRIGAGDGNGIVDHVDGVYFEYDFATHGHHRWMLCAASNSVRTKVDTGQTVVAGENTRLKLVVSADATQLTGFVQHGDGGVEVPCASAVAANIPATTARLCQPCLQAGKQLGAGALTYHADAYEVRQEFTSAR